LKPESGNKIAVPAAKVVVEDRYEGEPVIARPVPSEQGGEEVSVRLGGVKTVTCASAEKGSTERTVTNTRSSLPAVLMVSLLVASLRSKKFKQSSTGNNFG
jgi:hypothetical protein